MKKNFVIGVLCGILGMLIILAAVFLIEESDIDFDDMFSSPKTKVSKNIPPNTKNTQTSKNKFRLFQPKVNIKQSSTKDVKYQTFNNGLFSMQIPKGWVVSTGKSDHIHYTFMAYNPQNPDYKIFFNMKTEGYLKTQQMKNFYAKYYPAAPMAKLPVISPQTTDGFYKVFTTAYNLEQSRFPFKIPVIKNFTSVQKLGKNMTGGSIVRATYLNEKGKKTEGIFTATIKEFAMPPVVILIVYNTVFFTAPENELVDWFPVLNYCLSTVTFSNNFINAYYKEQGQVVQNAQAIQKICNQTSDIITSGWNERQKTYDILSQKRSDATMGYERVIDTDTGEIYKATNGFSDHDWHGKYEPITDEMYNMPVAGYIEKQ